jgi:hypothetical protein
MTFLGKWARWWKLNYHYLAWLCLIGGLGTALVGGLGVAYIDGTPPTGFEAFAEIGAWGYWGLLLGMLAALAGGFYTYSHLSKLRTFERLMSNRGRANFIKDLDEIEHLAYNLGPSFEMRVYERKLEYRLR